MDQLCPAIVIIDVVMSAMMIDQDADVTTYLIARTPFFPKRNQETRDCRLLSELGCSRGMR